MAHCYLIWWTRPHHMCIPLWIQCILIDHLLRIVLACFVTRLEGLLIICPAIYQCDITMIVFSRGYFPWGVIINKDIRIHLPKIAPNAPCHIHFLWAIWKWVGNQLIRWSMPSIRQQNITWTIAVWKYTSVVVNFDALAQASDFQIERRQVVFHCWMQDLNQGVWIRISNRVNARWKPDWAIEDQAKKT